MGSICGIVERVHWKGPQEQCRQGDGSQTNGHGLKRGWTPRAHWQPTRRCCRDDLIYLVGSMVGNVDQGNGWVKKASCKNIN